MRAIFFIVRSVFLKFYNRINFFVSKGENKEEIQNLLTLLKGAYGADPLQNAMLAN
jgi:hypothetical protein